MIHEMESLSGVLAPARGEDGGAAYQLYGLDKWDLFMRFVIAFRNGFTGVRYDDAYEMDHIQERLDALFGSGAVGYMRGFDGRAILFPRRTRDGRTGFVRYSDCFFSSEDAMAEREGLMRSIRGRAGGVLPLLVACALRCSSEEVRLLREAGLWRNLPAARRDPGPRVVGKKLARPR